MGHFFSCHSSFSPVWNLLNHSLDKAVKYPNSSETEQLGTVPGFNGDERFYSADAGDDNAHYLPDVDSGDDVV